MRIAMFEGYHGGSLGEIRAFTADEIARVQSEINRVAAVISGKQDELSSLKLNPLNWALGTQRDAMTRMENSITQDQHVLAQLQDSRDATIESGDTDKLRSWFALAAVVGDQGDMSAWNEQVKYASAGNMISTVAHDTALQVKTPFGIPWWAWGLGALGLLLALRRR